MLLSYQPDVYLFGHVCTKPAFPGPEACGRLANTLPTIHEHPNSSLLRTSVFDSDDSSWCMPWFPVDSVHSTYLVAVLRCRRARYRQRWFSAYSLFVCHLGHRITTWASRTILQCNVSITHLEISVGLVGPSNFACLYSCLADLRMAIGSRKTCEFQCSGSTFLL